MSQASATAASNRPQPTAMSQWLCELSATEEIFKATGQAQLTRFAGPRENQRGVSSRSTAVTTTS
jgi:hypothetical protein